jgi:hypothetical protein
MEAHGEEAAGGVPLDFMQREVALRADLAVRDEDDCIWTPLRFLMRGPRPPREGESVLLVDVSGGTCIGQIVQVTGWEACVSPNWDTWSGPRSPPPRTQAG